MKNPLKARVTTGVVAAALAASATALTTPTVVHAAGTTSAPDTTLVSQALGGGPANGWADRPQISGNGRYVTFDSNATNLINGIPYPERRVYRRDLATGTTQIVSATSAGQPASEWSSFSWPSDDGNLVAFISDQFDLATPQALARAVYVRDLAAGSTELVSVSSSGRPANGASSRPMLSPDGRYVTFSSYASNLSTPAGNGEEQVYLRDRVTGTTKLVSVAADGSVGNKRSYRGMVSSDGRYVAFSSFATNLTAGANPDVESVFVRDMQTGTTTRVTVRATGQPAPLGGSRPYLSPDGRYVVFNTYDPLVASDTDTRSDVYVFDRSTGVMERQSTSVTGGNSDGDSLRGFITDDGARTTFNSFANTITRTDKNPAGDAFIRDRTTGTAKLVSVSWYNGPADAQSYRPVMSDDGSRVAFLSQARNLVQGDGSSDWQVYAVTPASIDGSVDTMPASATVTSPQQGATVPSPVTLAGTATDDRAVGDVYVQVRDNTSGLWLRPDGSWGSGAARIATTLAQPFATSTRWSISLSLPAGSYGFEVLALDTSRNAPTSRPWTGFKVGSADTNAPGVTVSSPTAGLVTTSPVSFSGRATDDVGVERAFIQVRNNDTGLWLRPDGTWGSGAQRLPVTLASPGGSSTGWSTSLPLDAGQYGFDVVAIDAAGNQSVRPWTGFRVGAADSTAPTVSVTSPQQGESITSPATLRGSAADNVGVAKVFVQVRDNATMQWLRPDGTWGSGAVRIPATLSGPGSGSTTWSLGVSLSPGSYGFDVVAIDSAGNPSTKPWTGFRVVSG